MSIKKEAYIAKYVVSSVRWSYVVAGMDICLGQVIR